MALEDPAIDADLARLARRIRAWREEAGLSLADLSVRSGVSRSTIHKIETLRMVPTIAVLLRVARGLERSPAELVGDDEPDRALAVLPAGGRQVLGSPAGVMVERLSGDLADPELEAWRVTLAPGHGSGKAPLDYDGEELLVGEAGEVVVEVQGERFRVGPGDAVHLKASLPHRWHNHTRRPARFLVVGTVPAALRAAVARRASGRGTPRVEGDQP
jgi:transcriptional regulator with XRE-family HTH domain